MRIAIALVLLLQSAHASAQALAVLEHPHCAESPDRVVRTLFAYGASGWRPAALSDPVREVDALWWPTTSRLVERAVQTRPPARKPVTQWEFSRDFYLKPNSPEALPDLPNHSGDFGGWCEPPRNKPLPLASSPGFIVEVAAQTQVPIRSAQRRILLRALLATYRSRELCTTSTIDLDKTEPVRISISDLVPTFSVPLDNSRLLVGLTLRRAAFECDSERGDTDLPRWFVLTREAQYVGSGLTFIQRLQVLGTQRRHILFWYTGYNEDGYVLYDEGLSKAVKYTWKYH